MQSDSSSAAGPAHSARSKTGAELIVDAYARFTGKAAVIIATSRP